MFDSLIKTLVMLGEHSRAVKAHAHCSSCSNSALSCCPTRQNARQTFAFSCDWISRFLFLPNLIKFIQFNWLGRRTSHLLNAAIRFKETKVRQMNWDYVRSLIFISAREITQQLTPSSTISYFSVRRQVLFNLVLMMSNR